MSKAFGFSLLELLCVVAIIGVLVGISLPAYHKYLIKARVLELYTIAEAYKLKLAENLYQLDENPKTYALDSQYISSVQLESANTNPAQYVIQVIAKMQTPQQSGIGLAQPANLAAPLTLELRGEEIADIISWKCQVAPEYNEYVPKNCQT